MILVDTSVWIDHFRTGNPTFAEMLDEALVLTHPLVIGELACGNLKNRTRILADLNRLQRTLSATHNEVLQLIQKRGLWRYGIGYIDAHLLTSALISTCQLWTLDQKLEQAVRVAGVNLYHP